MTEYEPIVINREEGGSQTISVTCPDCEANLYPSLSSSWSGTKVSPFYCYECDSKLTIGAIPVDG